MSHPLPALRIWASKLSTWLWAPQWSFFSFAAWYCLVPPFAAATYAMTVPLKYYGTEEHNPQAAGAETAALQVAVLLCLSSFLLGGASACGGPRYGTTVILWKALFGILASCVFGFWLILILFAQMARQ
jgi:hypothetical protein